MEGLKEYAGAITAAVSVVAALGALGLWAINVQVTPEFHRLDARIEKLDGRIDQLDGRIDQLDGRIDQLDGKIDTNLKVINQRFNRLENDMDTRFDRVEGEIRTIRNDIKTILLRLPPQTESG